jgi:signal transduction histidine kinase
MAVPGSDDDASASTLVEHLASELRLPLAALMRLGARCAASRDGDLAAAGQAVARECQRLDVLVANALEFGLPAHPHEDGSCDLLEVVEKAVAGQRALIEGLSIRVRVLESTREGRVAGERGELLETVAALFSDLLERVPRRGSVDVRVREVYGVVRVDCTSGAAAPALEGDRPTVRRATELLSRIGGELWEVCDDERGFGFALPRWRGTAVSARP